MRNKTKLIINIIGQPSPMKAIPEFLVGSEKKAKQLKNNNKLKTIVKQANILPLQLILLTPKLNMLTGIE